MYNLSYIHFQYPYVFRNLLTDLLFLTDVIIVTFVGPQAFKTQDGYILVGAGNDGLFRKLCKVRWMN